MLKSLRELTAKLPVAISKHQNLIIAFVLMAGLTLGAGLFVGELWGEGKVDRPLTPSAQKYSSARVQGASTSATGASNTPADSSSVKTTAASSSKVSPSSAPVSSSKSGASSTASTSTAHSSKPTPAPAPPPSATNPVNINTASAKELDALPGIGATYAQRIINNRPYASADELITKVDPSTGKAILYVSTYNKIKDMISVQ